MKTLILYATKYGSAEKCVQMLKSYMPGEVDVVNAKKTRAVDPTPYDQVIIGGSVYVGKVQKEITDFCQQYMDELLQKKVGLFVCCGTANTDRTYIEGLFPKQLVDHALWACDVGGEMNMEKMSFIERLAVNMIKKSEKKKGIEGNKKIDEAKLQSLAKAMA